MILTRRVHFFGVSDPHVALWQVIQAAKREFQHMLPARGEWTMLERDPLPPRAASEPLLAAAFAREEVSRLCLEAAMSACARATVFLQHGCTLGHPC